MLFLLNTIFISPISQRKERKIETSVVFQQLRLCHAMQGGVGSIPGRGTKIPHTSKPKNQNIKNRNKIVINSIKTLKRKKGKS